MRILMTGGTGLIGRSTTEKLLAAGNTVRLLSRHADSDAGPQVESWQASVTEREALIGAATDCDVVLHIAGIVEETPPDLTFQSVNVEGTRNIIDESIRAGVKRFVYMSSLGAERGESNYHASKLEAEQIVRSFPHEWLVLRPGNVYGPGDEVISRLVKFTRALPVVPVVDNGDQPFQPIWHNDLAEASVHACTGERNRQVLELAGPDIVTLHQLFDILAELTDRKPQRLPVPSGLLNIATKLASAVGVEIGITEDVLQMLLDGIYIQEGRPNGLVELGVTPTPIRTGLTYLLKDLPEQTLDDGFGKPQHRRIRARVAQPAKSSSQLFREFVDDWERFLPVETDAEPVGDVVMEEDSVLTLHLPLRGNISVRVHECRENAVTLATLDGHPLSGFVRFTFGEEAGDLVFEINVYDRAATMIDTIGMALGGSFVQGQVWKAAAQRVVDASGGALVGDIEHDLEDLNDRDVERVQKWFDDVMNRRQNQDRTA